MSDAAVLQEYDTYEDAVTAKEAERARHPKDATRVVVVQRSNYGHGFVVRSYPSSFLVRPHLKRYVRSVGYADV